MALSWTSPKDPNEVKDYEIDWSDLLDTDTISTTTWLMPTGVTKNSDTNTTTTTTIWLSSGTAGTTYSLTNRITTAGGRTYDRTVKLKVKDL
jgi:hypothetical protein